MAYDRDEILRQAIANAESEECVTLEEVIQTLPIASSTFYLWELEKSEDLKNVINSVKVRLKKKMRRNWRNSENATLQIAEFKLMASDDELERITISKVNAKVENVQPTLIEGETHHKDEPIKD
jgi:hypothetical protein